MKQMYVCLAGALLLGAGSLFAEDVIQFRGANAQGKYNESNLLKSWPQEGLTPLWVNEELGAGWGSVIKAGDRLYVTCQAPSDNKKESVVCLDLKGKKLWQTTTGAVWAASFQGARSTPTFVPGEKAGEGKIVTLSGNGDLFCLDAAKGTVLWSKNLSQTYETQFGNWGMAESPVVVKDKVFVTVTGKKALAVALKVSDGSVVWTSDPLPDKCAYVCPAVYGNQLLMMTADSVIGVEIETGKQIWKANYKGDAAPVRMGGVCCNPPIIKGNRFFVTAGYDQGGVMYEIQPDNKSVKKIWANAVLDPHHDGVVELDGKIYGSNWIGNDNGKWVCLDWETGKTIFETQWEKLGKGVTIAADGMLYLYEEKRGTIGLAKPGDKLDVVSSFQFKLGSGERWAHPVISDGILYLRRGKALAAYDIRKK